MHWLNMKRPLAEMKQDQMVRKPLAERKQDQVVWKPLVEHELTGAAQGSQQTLDATAGAHVEGWPFSLWEQVWVLGLAKHHLSTLEE